MKLTKYLVSLLLILVVLLVACSEDEADEAANDTSTETEVTTETEVAEATNAPEDGEPAGQTVIVMGDISDDPGEVIEGAQPLADYLASQLSDFGITEGQVRVASDADEMAELLATGEVDLYFDSIFPATLISDASGATPILRRWRFGVENYYSVIFTSKDSGITTIEELAGQMVALDNPFSTSGFLLPAAYLLEQDLTLAGKATFDDAVEGDEVGLVFSYDDENTLQWVLNGSVIAGATDSYNYDVAFPEDVREDLVFLANTDSVPRQVVVARPGMPEDLLAAVTEILINADEDEAAAEALDSFQTTQFDEFPEGIEDAQDAMRSMIADVSAIPLAE